MTSAVITINEISRTAPLLGTSRLARTRPPGGALWCLVGCCEGVVVCDEPRGLDADPLGWSPNPPWAGPVVVRGALDVDGLGAWLVAGGGVVDGGGAGDEVGVDVGVDVVPAPPPPSRPLSVSGTVTLRLMPPSFRPIGRTGAELDAAEFAASGVGDAAAAPAGTRTASITAEASATGGRSTMCAARWMLCIFPPSRQPNPTRRLRRQNAMNEAPSHAHLG
jgi:hypothetical protein